jgi:hypothetical protein
MTDTAKTSAASMLWIVLLTAASTLTTFVLACATPFASLAGGAGALQAVQAQANASSASSALQVV